MQEARRGLPGGGAVLVENVEVLDGEQLAPVDAGLDGAQASQHTHLLHVAHQGLDAQPLELGVDCVQAAHQVLQEQLERLREAQHRLVVDDEGRHLLAAVFDQLAVVGRRVRRVDGRRRRVVGVREVEGGQEGRRAGRGWGGGEDGRRMPSGRRGPGHGEGRRGQQGRRRAARRHTAHHASYDG